MLVSAEPGEWYELGSNTAGSERNVRFLIVGLKSEPTLPGSHKYQVQCIELKWINQLVVPNGFVIRQITDPEEQALLALQLGD